MKRLCIKIIRSSLEMEIAVALRKIDYLVFQSKDVLF
jgi:hypothetical protein